MYSRAVILCAAAALLALSAVRADDKPAADKPKASLKEGSDLPGPFRPYNVNGKYEKKFHCPTNEHGLNPGVLIFAQNVNTESGGKLKDLLKELDKYIVDRPKTRLNAFAVFVYNDMPDVVKDDDVREVHAAQLTRLKGSEPALQQVVLCLDSAPDLLKCGYSLDDQQIIVVLYDQLKVKKVYTGKDDSLDVAGIMKYVREDLAPFKK